MEKGKAPFPARLWSLVAALPADEAFSQNFSPLQRPSQDDSPGTIPPPAAAFWLGLPPPFFSAHFAAGREKFQVLHESSSRFLGFCPAGGYRLQPQRRLKSGDNVGGQWGSDELRVTAFLSHRTARASPLALI